MRYSPRVRIPRRCITANYLLAFAFSATFAFGAAFLFCVSNQKLPLESKPTRQSHAAIAGAGKLDPGNAAGKKDDAVRIRRDEVSVAKEHFQEGEADDPDARLNWFWFQRMYPFNDIPASARRQAWESLPLRDKQGRFSENLEAGSTTWVPIGPAPTTSQFPNNGGATSGRINAIAVSPLDSQIVLIGSATGGIWRSADGGTTFTPVTDNQVDLAVGTIAFAPSSPNIVYAGMGDQDDGYFGSGVLKSTDAGVTWSKVSNATLPDKGQSMRIQVDPNDANKVYLAEDKFVDATGTLFVAGIYVSTDGGVNWTRTLACRARDVVIHPTDPQIVYASLQFSFSGQTAGVYKSINGGSTWTQVFVSPYTGSQTATRDLRIAVTPASPNRVYIFFGTRTTSPFQVRLEMSDDAGATWTNRGVISNSSIDPGQFGYNTYLAASPTDPNLLYVGTRDVFRSTDGGVTFADITNSYASPWPNGSYTPLNQKFHSDQQSFAFQPGSSTTFYAGSDGGLWNTTDGGATFTSLNPSLSLSQFVSLGVHPTDGTKSYGGTQDNGTQRRLSGTNGWKEFSSGDGGALVINPLDPSMVFTSYVSGRISRFRSDGFTFSGVIADADSFGESLTSPRISFYPPIVGNRVDSKLYVGTWRLFICSDCANTSKVYGTSTPPTWTAPGGTTDLTNGNGDVLSAIAVALSNNNMIYTGSRAGRVMLSTDGGVTWTNMTSGLPIRSITSITVSPSDSTLVYLTVSGYGTGHVFKSSNSGTTWTNISNTFPNIPSNAFLIDPLTPATLYVGTDIGVFRSTDGGSTWAAFNSNLPPVPVMAFTAQASGLIQIGTYGRGAYELPLATPTPTPNAVQFSASSYSVNEGAKTLNVTVTRTGDTSAAASAGYQTIDDPAEVRCDVINGTAYARCDYATSIDTLTFAPGETSKSFSIPIIDDSFAEGNETFSVALSNATGATLGAQTTATVTIMDNDPVNGANPILASDNAGIIFFVRQHYLDFLAREPEVGEPWSAILRGCADQFNVDPASPSAGCDRLTVSGSIFGSPEFLSKGVYTIVFYRVAFNRLPQYVEFAPDLRSVTGTTPAETFAKRAAFANNFVLRSEFVNAYGTMSNSTYVTTLMGRYGLTSISTPDPANPGGTVKVVLTTNDLTNRLNAATLTRAQVLRAIVQSDQVTLNFEAVNAFVASQYYGYLRRTPDTGGFNDWVTHLSAHPGDYRTMVNGFMNSIEYRLRFGPA